MDIRQKLDFAQEVLSSPWSSSEEEKLQAIQELQSIPGAEAVTLLRKGLELVRTPLPGSRSSEPVVFPRAGRVSVAAARALGMRGGRRAVETLVEFADSASASVIQREVAVFGLGQISDPVVCAVLQKRLMDTNSHVRRAAVEAIQQILARGDSAIEGELHTLLCAVATYAFSASEQYAMSGHAVNDGRRLALSLVSQHLTPELCEEMIDVLLHSDDDEDCERAAEVLMAQRSSRAVGALRQSLLARNRPQRLYEILGQRLAESDREQMHKVADRIVHENIIMRAFSLSRGERSRSAYRARRQAGERILGAV